MLLNNAASFWYHLQLLFICHCHCYCRSRCLSDGCAKSSNLGRKIKILDFIVRSFGIPFLFYAVFFFLPLLLACVCLNAHVHTSHIEILLRFSIWSRLFLSLSLLRWNIQRIGIKFSFFPRITRWINTNFKLQHAN